MKKKLSELEKARRREFMTLKDVSKITGRAPSTIVDWEKGRYEVPEEFHEILAEAYETEKSILWPGIYQESESSVAEGV